jgi:hypothetical protein
MNKFKVPDCPLCGDSLELNEKGHFHSKDGLGITSVYFCEGCDQSFAMVNGELHLAPFDSDMNPLKFDCKTCGTTEQFRQKMVFIMNDSMVYDTYCIDCGVEFLRNWLRCRRNKSKTVDFVTKDNVMEMSDLHAVEMENDILNNPEKLKKIQESEPF